MKKLFLLCIFFSGFVHSQSKYDEKLISTVCEASRANSIFILRKLSIESNSFKNQLTIETLKKVYMKQLIEDKERIQEITKNDPNSIKHIDFLLNSSKSSYKYALCEKYKRRDASIETISAESYFLCRESISTEKETRPNPCF
jgi:hypothetical protein